MDRRWIQYLLTWLMSTNPWICLVVKSPVACNKISRAEVAGRHRFTDSDATINLEWAACKPSWGAESLLAVRWWHPFGRQPVGTGDCVWIIPHYACRVRGSVRPFPESASWTLDGWQEHRSLRLNGPIKALTRCWREAYPPIVSLLPLAHWFSQQWRSTPQGDQVRCSRLPIYPTPSPSTHMLRVVAGGLTPNRATIHQQATERSRWYWRMVRKGIN